MNKHVRVVVIGGGVVGCSVLYHLTRRGWKDVVLLERSELTAGSTWHAAGGIHTLNGDPNVAALQAYTIRLYREIEQASGLDCGIHQPGCVYLATHERELDFFRVERSKARHLGIDLDFIDLADVKKLNPLVDTTRFLGAMYDPNDGYVDPSSVTQAYARAARNAGAQIHRHTPVTSLRQLPNGEWEISTPEGIWIAEFVVNAAGLWAREVGRLAGLELPIVPMEHQYVVTNDIPELAGREKEVAMLVDFDGANYVRQEGRGLLLGTYEQDCRHWAVNGTPLDFGIELLPPDLDRIGDALEEAMRRIPALEQAGIKRVVNGGMVFSPDGNPIIGPAPGLTNYFLAAGCMAGFSQGGGVGLAVANWIVDGEPGMDVFAMDVTRFAGIGNRPYVLKKAEENYRRRFIIPCPNEELEAARPLRTSPIYEKLQAAGAVFGVAAGWEVPLWFAASASEAREMPSFRRSNAYSRVAEECHAVRTAAGLWETSSYSKIEIAGPDAASWLDGIVANRVPVEIGRVALCPLLTPGGRILGDVSIVRLSEDRLVMMGSPAAATYYLRWLHANQGDAQVRCRDMTAELCGVSVTGPLARELLARVADQDVSAAALPLLRGKRMAVGLADAWVLRISFTGELGFEIYTSPDHFRHLFTVLQDAGKDLGVRCFGARALNSLRLEKGYGGWGREYTSDYTPAEADLAKLVRLDKPSFIGKAAATQALSVPVERKLTLLAIDSDAVDPFGGEAVFAGTQAVARLTSAARAYTLGHGIGFAYLSAAARDLKLEVEILGERYAASVLDAAPYNPTGARLRS